MYRELIKEICHELNIKYTFLSKEWIIKLEKGNKIRYLTGNKFDLNGHAIGNIMDDKYAMYEVLNDLNIPVCPHHIMYRPNNLNTFAIKCHTKEDLIKIFNKYNHNVVIKPNHGSMGIGVYHITNEKELFDKTNILFQNNYSISICPYYNIKNEYRLIVLDNEIKLVFKKIKPTITGNGTSTLQELLTKFNREYYKDKDIPNIIPKKGEIYNYDFKFNLSRGSIASSNIDVSILKKLSQIALSATSKIGIRFASVDIIEIENDDLMILELNSGVTINKVTKFIRNGKGIAKEIYKEAIIKMFNE